MARRDHRRILTYGVLMLGSLLLLAITLVSAGPDQDDEDPETARLFGRVEYQDGSPAAAARIAIVREYACTETSCHRIDADRLDIAADAVGNWSAAVAPGGFTIATWGDGGVRTQTAATLRPGETRQIPLILTRPNPSVNVRVTAVDAVDGAPVIADAFVNFRAAERAGTAYAATTDPGTVRVEVEASRWQTAPCGAASNRSSNGEPTETAVCRQQGNDHDYHAWFGLFTAQANDTLDLTVQLERMPRSPSSFEVDHELQGWVVDASGTGMPQAIVSAYSETTRQWGYAVTDHDGAYRLMVSPGHLTLHAAAKGYLVALEGAYVPFGGAGHADLTVVPLEGTCCWKQPASYPIAQGGLAAEPPAWLPVPVHPDEILPWRAWQSMDSLEAHRCLDWCQDFAGLDAGLGPYDPSEVLSSAPAAGASQDVPALALGMVSATTAWVANRIKDRTRT